MKKIKIFILSSTILMLGILNFTQSERGFAMSEAQAYNSWSFSSSFSSSGFQGIGYLNWHTMHKRLIEDSIGPRFIATDSLIGDYLAGPDYKERVHHKHGPKKCTIKLPILYI